MLVSLDIISYISSRSLIRFRRRIVFDEGVYIYFFCVSSYCSYGCVAIVSLAVAAQVCFLSISCRYE